MQTPTSESSTGADERWLDLQRRRHLSRRDFAEYQFQSARGRAIELGLLAGTDKPMILDVGCGLGGMSAAYAVDGATVTAVDEELYDTDSIRFAEEFAASKDAVVEYVGGSETHWSFDNDRFDLVLLDSVIEHAKEPARLLEQSTRVLRPGGWMLISFPVFYGPFGGHIDDYIKIPWFHLLPRRLVHSVLRRCRPKGGYVTPEFSVGVYDSLNRMSLRRFKKLIEPLPFEEVVLRRSAFLTTPGNQLVYDVRQSLSRGDRAGAWRAVRRMPKDFTLSDLILFPFLFAALPLNRIPVVRELFLGGVRASLRKAREGNA